MLHTGCGRNDENVARKTSDDSEETAAEVIAGAEGRNNDSDVFGRVGRVVGQSDGLKCPGGDDIDYQTSVSPEPTKQSVSDVLSLIGSEYLPEADECQKVVHAVVVDAFYTRVLMTGP